MTVHRAPDATSGQPSTVPVTVRLADPCCQGVDVLSQRIDKTMHLLSLVDPVDDTYRRRMNRQLTV